MRLFLDANVLFTAAHNPGGKASFVVDLASRGHWRAVTSALAVEEARRNLEVKFAEPVPRLDELLTRVAVVATVVGKSCPVRLPPKDQHIFLSALRSGCTHLLTGDRKHFGVHMNRPKDTEGIVVQTVADFLASL